MRLEYINSVIDDYRRWIREGKVSGHDVKDLEVYLARWEYDRAQKILEIENLNEHGEPWRSRE